MNKSKMYGLGLITLMMAPLGWILCGLPPFFTFLQLDSFSLFSCIKGMTLGCISGILMLIFTANQEASVQFHQQIQFVRSLKLNLVDCIFLSFCAGFGEEILFRIALQQWLHPLLAAFLFVSVHGYIRPKDWSTTKYGLLVFVFISILSYTIRTEGLWFCIAAHAFYDFVIFRFWSHYHSEY